MSRIRDIEVLPLEFPLPAGGGYGSARGLVRKRGAALVRLFTADGIEGIGEAWGPPRVTAAYLEMIRPYFLGASLFSQRGVTKEILAKHYHNGIQNQLVTLLAGIDIAAHDAMGKRLGVSVAELIGGRLREDIPVYASGGYFTEAADQQAALAAQLEAQAGLGFTAYKIKIGRHPRQDAERTRLARRIIGDDALLTVDGNGNYTADGVLESMHRIADADIHWYEEPLAPQDWQGYAQLRDQAPIRVATGEALYTIFDFRRVIDGRLAAVLQPDLTLCGGLDAARDIGALAGAAHLRISPHCWGSGIGMVAAMHFLAALPAYPHADHVPFPPLLEYDVGQNALRDSLFTEPVRCRDSHVALPQGPGLGVTLDWDAVKRFTPA